LEGWRLERLIFWRSQEICEAFCAVLRAFDAGMETVLGHNCAEDYRCGRWKSILKRGFVLIFTYGCMTAAPNF